MLHFLCFSAFVDLGHGRRDYLGHLLGMIGWVDNGARFVNNPRVQLFSTVSNRLQMSTFNKGPSQLNQVFCHHMFWVPLYSSVHLLSASAIGCFSVRNPARATLSQNPKGKRSTLPAQQDQADFIA
ncbi:uncharacterized protein K441DRAFT_655931 [Cenococcum geophilum 1.58]|uniref:uncharacterized protein n=1 Tax=Cenococcum geophilum 1.58 TaxID=794803 RepID=UPI00358FEE86|nr:hypothetical protein K441DRAFT_655931 [Cenococcum geophilum 1.58]